MSSTNQFVTSQNLCLDTFVVGYPKLGESQVILIRDFVANKILFSCIIDCYKQNDINKTHEILSNNNVKKLDLVIWTHTDEDHSIGFLDIINDFCSVEKTTFWLPEFKNGHDDDMIDYNPEIRQTFDKINMFNHGVHYNVNSISVHERESRSLINKKFIDITDSSELQFKIIAIAPNSALLRRRRDSKSVFKKKNDFSIALIVEFGGYRLLFSGDVEDQTINLFDDSIFCEINYVKTPHHTSRTSTKLLDILRSKNETLDIVVTTINSQYKLPDNDIVKEYKTICKDFYSTHTGDEGFGVVESRYIPNNPINSVLLGNAIKL